MEDGETTTRNASPYKELKSNHSLLKYDILDGTIVD